METSRWHVAAFGSGVIFSALCGWAYGSLSPHASTLDYARVMGLTFLLAFGVGALVYEAPAWYAALWYQLREAEHHRLEAATYQRQRSDLRYRYIVPDVPKVIDADAENWRVFNLGIVNYIIAHAEGDPRYKGGLDAAMNYAAWRAWTDPLVKAGILSPIAGGVRTSWAEGWSAARLLGKLEGGYAPPPPPGPPPNVQLRDS